MGENEYYLSGLDNNGDVVIAESMGITAENSSTEINWPKVIFSVLICIIGLIGNTVVIFVIVVLKEHKKSATHWYVLQLAIADSLFLLTIPFKVSEDLNEGWIYEEWVCKGKETILFLNYYTSIMLLMLMSVDRYIAVCHTFSDKLQKLRKPVAAVCITNITWLVTLCMCVPVMLYSATVGNQPYCKCSYVFPSDDKTEIEKCLEQGTDLNTCMEMFKPMPGDTKYCKHTSKGLESWFEDSGDYDNYQTPQEASGESRNKTFANATAIMSATTVPENKPDEDLPRDCTYVGAPHGWKVFMVFNFVVMYALPVIVMVVCYSLIIKRLSNSFQFRKSSTTSLAQATNKNQSKISKSDKDRRRITIMCATLVTTFVLLWLPFHVNHLAKLHGINVSKGMEYICYNLPVVGSLLAYLNSALNPYLYSFLGSNFMRRWRQAKETIVSKRRTSNVSSSVGIRYTKKSKRRGTNASMSNTATAVTKVYRGRSERGGSMSETRASQDSSHANGEALKLVSTIPTNEIETAVSE